MAAEADRFGTGADVFENPRIHQVIVKHDIGAAKHSTPRSVIRPGSPGPAPTRYTLPVVVRAFGMSMQGAL